MATATLEEKSILMDLHTFALFAKALQARKSYGTPGDPIILDIDGNGIDNRVVCRLGFNPTLKIRGIRNRNKSAA